MKQALACLILVACSVTDEPELEEDEADLTAPAAGAVKKPTNFYIVPPWAPSEAHGVTGGYGPLIACPTDPTKLCPIGLHTGTKEKTTHNDYHAIDLGFTEGTPVYPTAVGTVIYSGDATGAWAGYGRIVMLDHVVGNKHFQSLYAHLSSIDPSVEEIGHTVTTVTMIGQSGSAGTTAAHLHFALYRGAKFNMTRGPHGGRAVVPEPFSSCTLPGGGRCEDISFGDTLQRSSALGCRTTCAQCVLEMRPDILPFYANNGWTTTCDWHDRIVNNWCGIDPAGCAMIKHDLSCRAHCIP
jgi:hypothetical protein